MDDEELIGFSDTAIIKPELKQKNGKRSGGFQAMGLSFPVLKGVLKRGYKVPTPIQRKVYLNTITVVTKTVYICALFDFRQYQLLWKIVISWPWLEQVVEKLLVF